MRGADPVSVAVPGRGALHLTPRSLSAGRTGPLCYSRPVLPRLGVAFACFAYTEPDPACFCPFCLPYALNPIQFQGHFQSHLEYGREKKKEYGHKSKEGSLRITPSLADHGREHPAFMLKHRRSRGGCESSAPIRRGSPRGTLHALPWSAAGRSLGADLPPESLAALIITLL